MENVLIIDVRYVNDILSLSAYEQTFNRPRTIEFFEDLPDSVSPINDDCLKLFNYLNKSIRFEKVEWNALKYIKYLGQSLYDRLFTLRVKELLHSTSCQELILKIDGTLAQIPWELLYDGNKFLSQRFNMGRMVITRQTIAPFLAQTQKRQDPIRILILADPQGNLEASYEEGVVLFDNIKNYLISQKSLDNININLKTSYINVEFIKKSLREFDIIHYAGHVEYCLENPDQGGWQTADGEISIKDILEMIGGASLPLLIFSNACQSGRTEPWCISSDGKKGAYGQANAFLLAGVQHYIGTFCNIPDLYGKSMAVEFYQNLLKGMSIGQSLRQARLHFIQKFNDENITWMAYMLYGDPTQVYFDRNNPQTTSDSTAETIPTMQIKKAKEELTKKRTAKEKIFKNPFQYHGHLDPVKDSLVFIHRDNQKKRIINGLADLNYYAIIAPRQTGKTTFMLQLINKIKDIEFYTYEPIYITLEDLVNIRKNEFYANIARKIINWLRNKYVFTNSNLLNGYEKIKNNLGLEEFFIELSKAEFCYETPDGQQKKIGKKRNFKFIIFIDEIDAIKNLSLEFLRTIRAIHEQSSFVEGFDRFSFIISGAINLAKLSLGRTSPFNIAERVYLEDFMAEEVIGMIKNTLDSIQIKYYKSFPKEIFQETNGHPCLVQKLCGKIVDNAIIDKRGMIQKDDLTRQINNLIEEFDETLKTIWENIKKTGNLDVLKRVFKGECIKYNECDEFSYELKLAGAIVKNEKGFCRIRNNILRTFFAKQFEVS